MIQSIFGKNGRIPWVRLKLTYRWEAERITKYIDLADTVATIQMALHKIVKNLENSGAVVA